MSDDNEELKSQLHDAEARAKAAEASLKNEKARRVKFVASAAIGGFLLFAVGGQWMPGYQLDSTAKAASSEMATSAVGEVMAGICAERFLGKLGLESRLSELQEFSNDRNRATYIQDGTWANTPDGKPADFSTAEKCGSLIAEQLSDDKEKSS